MTPEEFMAAAFAAAKAVAARGHAIIPWVVASQAALESRYGQSRLSTQAHNYFGIKAGKSWTGKSLVMPTKEFVNGKQVAAVARWRVYPSMESCFNDYAAMIERLPWYADAVAAARRGDGHGFLRGLLANGSEPGWATDPKYESKVLMVAQTWSSMLT